MSLNPILTLSAVSIIYCFIFATLAVQDLRHILNASEAKEPVKDDKLVFSPSGQWTTLKVLCIWLYGFIGLNSLRALETPPIVASDFAIGIVATIVALLLISVAYHVARHYMETKRDYNFLLISCICADLLVTNSLFCSILIQL